MTNCLKSLDKLEDDISIKSSPEYRLVDELTGPATCVEEVAVRAERKGIHEWRF